MIGEAIGIAAALALTQNEPSLTHIRATEVRSVLAKRKDGALNLSGRNQLSQCNPQTMECLHADHQQLQKINP
jgi:hypothetical protein